MTRQAVLLPWLASHSPDAAARLASLAGTPAHDRTLEALEPHWFAWAIAQGAAWPRSRIVGLFDQVERMIGEGYSRHDAERTALALELNASAFGREAA